MTFSLQEVIGVLVVAIGVAISLVKSLIHYLIMEALKNVRTLEGRIDEMSEKIQDQADELGKKIQRSDIILAEIIVRLEKLNDHDKTIREHAAKIAFFEGSHSEQRTTAH